MKLKAIYIRILLLSLIIVLSCVLIDFIHGLFWNDTLGTITQNEDIVIYYYN